MANVSQYTVTSMAVVTGRGYWSGRPVTVRIAPAPVGSGRFFVREDLPGSPLVPALLAYRAPAARRTVLVNGQARVEMTEHVLAALYCLGIDNCAIRVNAEELPGLDGSSWAYVEALEKVGTTRQAAPRKEWVISSPIEVSEGNARISAFPAEQTQVAYSLVYPPETGIPSQSYASPVTAKRFRAEMASARTFVTRAEADQFLATGLGAHVGPDELLIFESNGETSQRLRFPNECARHKVLDILGDLALTGLVWQGAVVAHGGGHKLNAALAERLLNMALQAGNVRAG